MVLMSIPSCTISQRGLVRNDQPGVAAKPNRHIPHVPQFLNGCNQFLNNEINFRFSSKSAEAES